MQISNSGSFTTLCGGEFGRKMITTHVDSIHDGNILEVLGNADNVHMQNQREIEYLYQYVGGNQPSLFRTKEVRPEIKNNVVQNHALEIVRFFTSLNFGEPMQYVGDSADEGKANVIDRINNFMEVLGKDLHDVRIGEWQSTCGTAYREVWTSISDEGMPSFGIDVPDPRYNYVVYSSKRGNEPMMSVSHCFDEDGVEYKLCTTATHVYTVKGKEVSSVVNGYGFILLTEYPNNSRRMSEVESVITLLDTINNIQSNRADGIEQHVQSLIKFINCDIDENKISEMNKVGAIKIKTVDPQTPADVDVISNELSQTQTQTYIDDLRSNVLVILGMPSREQNTGGDTGQAVYLRNGWDFAEQRAKLHEASIKKSEREFLQKVLRILKANSQIPSELSILDIGIQITRNQTDNMLVKAQALDYFMKNNIDPKTAIATCGLWGDSDKVWLESMDYIQEAKDLKRLEIESKVGKLGGQIQGS